MKRVIKSSVSGLDKLRRIEQEPSYDADWQTTYMDTIIDNLEAYKIDVTIEEVTDQKVMFTTFQPDYPDVGTRKFEVTSYGSILTYTSHGTNRDSDINTPLYYNLSDRFQTYFAKSSEYISAIQRWLDKVSAKLNRKYNITCNLLFDSVIAWNTLHRIILYLSSESSIEVDGIFCNVLAPYVNVESNKYGRFRIEDFLLDMSPENLIHFMDVQHTADDIENTVLNSIKYGFLNKSEIPDEVASQVNAKLAKSKYDVYIESIQGPYLECVLQYGDNEYSFETQISPENTFDIWFGTSNRNFEAAIEYNVNKLYKRIAAKCRKIISKNTQQSQDSAML